MTEQTISVPEAANRLGITTEEAYKLAFARQLRTVESPSGRRVVPITALDEVAGQHESADHPG